MNYDIVLQNKNKHYETLSESLQLVEEIIKKKKLVIYGGNAIHYALLLKKHPGIYSTLQLPDFDVFTDESFYEIGNNIAKELHEDGITAVDVITAIHPQTRKVRSNGFPLLDITYIDMIIPTLEINGLIFANTLVQRLSLYLTLSLLFGGFMSENIKFRKKKDTERLALIDEYYPVSEYCKDIVMSDTTIDFVPNKEKFYTGIFAYAMYYSLLSNKDGCYPVIFSDNKLTYPQGITHPITIYDYHKDYNKTEKYKRFNDFLPKRLIDTVDNVKIEVISIKYSIQFYKKIDEINVMYFYNLLLYFTCMYFIENNPIYLVLLDSMIRLHKNNNDHEIFLEDTLEITGDILSNYTTPEQILKKMQSIGTINKRLPSYKPAVQLQPQNITKEFIKETLNY